MINGAHTSVIHLIAPLCNHWKRQLYGKGQESSVLDVDAAYIRCTNNQYKRELSADETLTAIILAWTILAKRIY